MNWKIIYVKDTDWSNRVGSEIDSEVKIFDILAFPSIQLYFNGLVLFFPHQIEPSAHRGPVLKNCRSKNFFIKNHCISPTYKCINCIFEIHKQFWIRWYSIDLNAKG